MNYTVRKNSGKPGYLQLYEQFREDIVQEVYKYGEKLPSKRVVASDVQVSVITVEHAYAILCDEGYAESRERSGYYVCYRDTDVLPVVSGREANRSKNTVDNADKTVEVHRSIPDIDSNDILGNVPEIPDEELRTEYSASDTISYPMIAKTMRKVLTTVGDRILIKSPGNGVPELRNAIAAYLARSRGIHVSAEQIVIGSGSEYLYSLIVQLLGHDRVFALEDPSYEKIRRMYEANGVCCEMLKMGKNGIHSAELERSTATVLHVTPFNSYPSGVSASASKKREYIHWAASREGIIIEDDFDSEFTVSKKAEDTLFSMEPDRSVIYMNTFTKTVAPSMRIGYMVLPAEMVQKYQKEIGYYSSTVPTFEQYVLAELINSGDFERHINRVRRSRRKLYEQ